MNRSIKMALQSIKRGGASSVSTVMSVMFATLLCTGFFMFSMIINNATNTFEDNLLISVQIDAELPQEDVEVLASEIQSIEGVMSVTYSSADEELDSLIESYGELGPTFEVYKGEDNPLDAVLKVEVSDPSLMQGITTEIEQLDNVKLALYGGSDVDTFIASLQELQKMVLIIAVIAIIVPLFLITNAIKISIFHRKKEIEIMRYVGATANFIRIPFLLEGVFLSMIGIVITMLFIVPGYANFFAASPGYLIFPVLPLPTPQELFKVLIPIQLLIGCGIGVIGSIFSLGNHLNK